MSKNQDSEVFVLSVRKPLPKKSATGEELSAFAQLTLKPISMISKQVTEIYAGPEYEESDYYRREWAIQAKPGLMDNIKLNREIFSLRRVTEPEIFCGKYRDFNLTAHQIEE